MSNISGVDVSLITSIGGVSIASITSLGGIDVTSIGSWPGGYTGPRTLIDQDRISFGYQRYPGTPPYPDIYYLLGYINIEPILNADNAVYKATVEMSSDGGNSWYNRNAIIRDFTLNEKTGQPDYRPGNGFIMDVAYRPQGYMNEYFKLTAYPVFGDYTTYFMLILCAGDTQAMIDPYFVSLEQYYQGTLL